MDNYYILSSNGELYHAAKLGSAKKAHKYIDREWKNGRWVYTYHENTKPNNTNSSTSTGYPIGQNYSKIGTNKPKTTNNSQYPIGQNYSKMDSNKKYVDYDSEEAVLNRRGDSEVRKVALERSIENAKSWVDDMLQVLSVTLKRK